jgi:hypothetical protein
VSASRPTDICLVLATLHDAPWDSTAPHGWLVADEVRSNLGKLGFAATAQVVGNWLGRVARLDCPPIDVRQDNGWNSYRVNHHGETWLHNVLPDIWYAHTRQVEHVARHWRVAASEGDVS